MRLTAVILTLGLTIASATKDQGPTPRITIRLANAEAISRATRLSGELLASKLLARAGISVIWVECPCDGQPGRAEFWMHVLAGEPPGKLLDATGFSVIYLVQGGMEGYAGVFYKRVVEVADREGSPESVVLGAALAHEIGHLLLGPKSHSSSGVMQPRLRHRELGCAARGELRFSPEEAEAMAADVRRRMR